MNSIPDNLGNDSTKLVRVVAWVLCACAACASAIGAETDALLAHAKEAYAEGNYRGAAAQLNELSRKAIELSREQKLAFWDTSADLAEASGLFLDADKAARTHLELLQQASAAGTGPSFAEQNALVRLARIQRALAGPVSSGARRAKGPSPRLSDAVEWYRKALPNDGADAPRRPLWEAEARFEFARTLELLGQPHEAARELARAGALAKAALDALELSDGTANRLERAIFVLRQAAPTTDQAAMSQQASAALQWVENRLKAGSIPLRTRGKLLAARADCIGQLNDEANEIRMLNQLLDDDDEKSIVEPLIRGKALVRLAELTDREAAAQRKEELRRQADAFYARAAELYDRGLQTAVAEAGSPDRRKRTASRATQAECLMQLQLIYTRLADWPRAIRAGEQLLALRARALLARSDPNYFRTLASLGALYARQARTANLSAAGEGRDLAAARRDGRNAQRYLQPACEFWRTYRPLDAAELATALNHHAEALRYDGEFRQADELLRVASPYCRAAYEPGDLRLGEYYSNHAAVQAALGLYALALDNYDAAVAAAKSENATDLRERPQLLAMIYLNKAQLHKSQRQLAEARALGDQASAAARDAGIAAAILIPFELARASLLIAEAEQNYEVSVANGSGGSASASGNSIIKENLSAAADITSQLLAAPRNANPLQLAMARHLSALANFRLFELGGAGDDSLRAAEASWKLVAQPDAAHEEAGIDILQIRALNHLANLALRDAADSRHTAYEASRHADADENSIRLLTQHAESRLQEAEVVSRSAEVLARNMVAYPAVRAQALFSRAQVLNAAARVHLAKARRNRDSGAADRASAAHHDGLAQAKIDEAIQTLRSALEIIELPRAMTVGANEERADYLAQFAPAFDLVIDLLMEQGGYLEAIRASEQRRSRTFQDQLAAAGIDIEATANPQAVRRAQQARDAYYTTLDALRQSWDGDDRRGQLSERLAQLQREFVAAEQAVKSSSRAARQLLVETAATGRTDDDVHLNDAAWMLKWIGEEGVALVYYIGRERSYVVACGERLGVVGQPLTLTAEQAHRRGLWMPEQVGDQPPRVRPLRAVDVIALVNDVRAWAERPLRDHQSQPVDLQRGPGGLRQTISAKIGPEHLFVATEILLPAELRAQIAAAQPSHVILVPDGALHQLPFELLPTDAPRSTYLLDELPPICYAPSLHIYRTLRAETKPSADALTLLSVADPDYSVAGDGSLAAAARALTSLGEEFHHYWDGRLSRLESAAEECAEVTAAFRDLGPGRVTIVPLTNADATERKLKDALATQRITMLHIAAHGLITQRHNNLFGALALATQPRPTAADDGFLALHEVFDLPLDDCHLAVLSACQTTCGPESPLEAGSTMARAFLCAGARRVVSSHWSVSDKATAPLIGGFMRNVARDLRNKGAADYAAALHAAKLQLRNDPPTAAPYFWAPFVLIGPPTDDASAGDALVSGP